jgi:DNA (cytosine-5)-methyltransferase 1
MKPTFKTIDLFAGIGGFRIAVERCGGQTSAFSEINADAINSYVRNFSESASANLGDITKIKQLPSHDLLTAGVPCQSWSIAGRNLGFDDDRGQLWNDALFLLKQSRPKAFIFENVKGLADPRNKDALNHIMERIREAGYFADYFVLDSFNYGVPQSRVRIYIIGFKEARFYDSFFLPNKTYSNIRLKDIIDDEVISTHETVEGDAGVLFGAVFYPNSGTTSLSNNNNGFNDYFLFNDLRNGQTTIHSWDIIDTTERQKEICLLLLRNRRKKDFGPLDGNPLSLEHFRILDDSIEEYELENLVSLGILKKEKYSYCIVGDICSDLTPDEKYVLEKNRNGIVIPDSLICDRKIKISRVNVSKTLESLESKGIVRCDEIRYEFRHTKISTGLFGINRIFLPSSNIFPTLVASDSNDYLTPVSIKANNAMEYRRDFMKHVLEKKQYRKISRTEALRIQGFPEDFHLSDSRSRWMKLIGNSVAVPVIEKLVNAIIETGVFDGEGYGFSRMTKTPGVSSKSIEVNTYRDLSAQNFKQLSLFESVR